MRVRLLIVVRSATLAVEPYGDEWDNRSLSGA
jgi:hypothetical protein